jgi:predicted nucleic acid-binding Zn ribbon protein
MHKKPHAGKKTDARIDATRTASSMPVAAIPGSGRRGRGQPHSVNQLLQRRGALSQLARGLPARQDWEQWLRERLEAGIAAHVLSVVPRPAPGVSQVQPLQLVVFADSAAWCTRLRYALSALMAQIEAHAGTPVRTSVRVLMPPAAAAAPEGQAPDG